MLSTQKFALVRILGNDLPPCHGPTQTIDNVRFILESEPDLPNCSKHWLINRMCNPMHEAHLVGLLESHGQSIVKLSFDLTEYANLPLMEETPYSSPWFRPARRKRLRLHATTTSKIAPAATSSASARVKPRCVGVARKSPAGQMPKRSW